MALNWYAVVKDGVATLAALRDTVAAATTLYDRQGLAVGGNGGIRTEGGLFIPADQLTIDTAADLQLKGIYLVNNTGNASGSMVGVALSYSAATDQVSGAAM
jgi:hypothetical protein